MRRVPGTAGRLGNNGPVRRVAVTVAAALCAAVLAGCGAAGAVGGAPATTATTAGPTTTPPGSPTLPLASGPGDPASAPGDPPVLGPAASVDPPSADPGDDPLPPPFSDDESMVWIPAGDHRVPGTLAVPARQQGQRVPAVLMLHGDLSSRDENGDMFARLAAALAAAGIASLRIDFAGTGDSEEPDLALDYPGMVLDATASLDYLRQDADVDPDRVAVLGLSRGGGIGATVTGTVPGVAAFVSWSGAVYNGYDEDPDGHQTARENGYLPLDFGDRIFKPGAELVRLDRAVPPAGRHQRLHRAGAAVVGSDDQVVDPEVSTIFLQTVASADTTLHVVDGADHGFTADESYGDEAIRVTRDWLVSRLG